MPGACYNSDGFKDDWFKNWTAFVYEYLSFVAGLLLLSSSQITIYYLPTAKSLRSLSRSVNTLANLLAASRLPNILKDLCLLLRYAKYSVQ
jgi:hypothetical protein